MYAYQKHYSELPLSDRGTYLKLGWGFNGLLSLRRGQAGPGEYKLRIRAGSVKVLILTAITFRSDTLRETIRFRLALPASRSADTR